MGQEICDKGSTQESIRVALAVTHYIDDMEPQGATSYSQAGTLVDQQRHEPTHKTFNPKNILPACNINKRDRTETNGMANQ